MGMYTGLRFEAKLTPLAAKAITLLNTTHYDTEGVEPWDEVAALYPEFDLKEWCKVERKNLFPFGRVLYMPDNWEEESKSIIKGLWWEVNCSLKNYEEEIEEFLSSVLPQLISEECEVETCYEEDNYSNFLIILPIKQ